MKNKGLILFFTILIALVCVYCLSFSFASWRVESKAAKYANDPAAIEEVKKLANGDVMLEKHLVDSVIDARTRQYLTGMNDSTVYLGNTYKQCKYKELNLGLDLKGGMNVTLEISMPDAVKSLATNTEDQLFKNAFEKAQAEYAKTVNGDFIDIFVKNFNAEKKALGLNNANLRTYFGERSGMKNATDDQIITFIRKESNEIVDRTFKILRTRIDRFGVAQPNLQMLQGGRILVELPGVKEPERVTDLLKSTAKLEFWEVYHDAVGGKSIQQRFMEADAKLAEQLKNKKEAQPAENEADAAIDAALNADTTLAAADAAAPADEEDEEEDEDETEIGEGAILSHAVTGGYNVIAYFKEADMPKIDQMLPELERILGDPNVVFYWGSPEKLNNGVTAFPLYPLKKKNDRIGPLLSSETIGGNRVVRTARQDVDQNNRVVVTMSMEDQAADEWRKITREAAAKGTADNPTCIAIVLDQFVYSAPSVRGEIPNGNSEISGHFSIEEAKDLATVLNSGNLEAGVNIVQSEIVGPTLGKESIRSGLLSFLGAFLLVVIYMFFYYSRAGLVADLALLLNVFFIIGVLASMGAVLTLPGIAGIVLTLGMAVDANVIIYERVREEVRAGKGMRVAIDEGFKNSYSAIIDGNVTTLITAIVLYIFGSGPIQGFATTLIIGILSSLFTAILVSRVIIEARLKRGKEFSVGTPLTINAFTNTHFDFLSTRKVFYIVSGALMLISIISFCTLGLQRGVDFTGGRSYVVRFDKDVVTKDVREAIIKEFGGSPEVKTFGSNNQVRIVTNYKIESNDVQVDQECEKKLYVALKGFYEKQNLSEYDFTHLTNDERGIQSSSKIQPTVARELLRNAIWAVLASLVLIFIYIAIRFRNWQFGMAGVFALFHDSFLTIGMFSLFYKVLPFTMEIDQNFIAAILTVIGYSINNVVVIFDRVRENLALYPKRSNYDNFNAAINGTLGRNVNTAATTLVTLLVIFIFGGEVIRGFVFAMFLGIAFGTYSGIFVSNPLAYDLLRLKKDKKGNKEELKK
ncbi:MAG: protein translocase subunit SecDF [Bacteroidales bacterium]|nr:protein translocase subunit SecDF [Bacteroidales bacterium]